MGRPSTLSVSPRVGSRGNRLQEILPVHRVPAFKTLRKIWADRDVRITGRRAGMDITWLDDRIAVGGGIWNADNMAAVSRAGITHIIDMQIEFDDTRLAEPYGVRVLWNPTEDDFRTKPAELFQRGVDFALEALEDPEARVFIHCAAGVHRAPMMALAVLRAQGWSLADAVREIEEKRDVVDFADVYVQSVQNFMRSYEAAGK